MTTTDLRRLAEAAPRALALTGSSWAEWSAKTQFTRAVSPAVVLALLDVADAAREWMYPTDDPAVVKDRLRHTHAALAALDRAMEEEA